jgi:hypothetical protein
MLYVGIDVHKSFSRIATLDPATGERRDLGNVPTHWELLQAEVAHLEGEKTVVLEAGRNSHFLAAHFEAVADQVWVVDPAALRQLVARGAKTNSREAEGLGGDGGAEARVAAVGGESEAASIDAGKAHGDGIADPGAQPDLGVAGAQRGGDRQGKGPVEGGSAADAGPVAGDPGGAGGAWPGTGSGGGAGGEGARAGAPAAQPGRAIL